jgi:hypothetical protein
VKPIQKTVCDEYFISFRFVNTAAVNRSFGINVVNYLAQ